MTREELILDALRQVTDPELGVNIVDLGLVYSVDLHDRGVTIKMTMTTQTCPLGDYLTQAVIGAVRAALPQLERVDVDMVWDPPWSPGMMSAAARHQLGRM